MRGSRIAIEIATAILTVNHTDGPIECTRAQMMLRGRNENHRTTERNMGGRNKQSIVSEIDAVLAAHGFTGESK